MHEHLINRKNSDDCYVENSVIKNITTILIKPTIVSYIFNLMMILHTPSEIRLFPEEMHYVFKPLDGVNDQKQLNESHNSK